MVVNSLISLIRSTQLIMPAPKKSAPTLALTAKPAAGHKKWLLSAHSSTGPYRLARLARPKHPSYRRCQPPLRLNAGYRSLALIVVTCAQLQPVYLHCMRAGAFHHHLTIRPTSRCSSRDSLPISTRPHSGGCLKKLTTCTTGSTLPKTQHLRFRKRKKQRRGQMSSSGKWRT